MNKLNIINNKKGMTLVETIIGVVILAICSIMLFVGFGTCAHLINEANKFKVESARISTDVEVGILKGDDPSNEASIQEGTVSFKDNTNEENIMFSVQGKYYKTVDDGTGLKYSVFVPNTIDKNLSNLD